MRFFRVPNILTHFFPQIMWQIPNEANNVYLTFDDGPHEIYSPKILDILEEHNVKATFFLLGEKIKPNREIILRMRDSGNTVGIHGYQHSSLLLKSKTFIREQLERAKDELESLTGEPVHLFRPPYGRFNPAVLNQCRQLSLRPVMWSFLTYDFDDRLSDKDLLDIFNKRICPGDIVVMHDGHVNSGRTVRVLPGLIEFICDLGIGLSRVDL